MTPTNSDQEAPAIRRPTVAPPDTDDAVARLYVLWRCEAQNARYWRTKYLELASVADADAKERVA